MKLVKIFTSRSRSTPAYRFRIKEIKNGYSINVIDYDFWGNEKVIEKVGETKSIDDAILLAKTRVKEPIENLTIE